MKRIILLSLISIFFTCSKKDESKSKDLPIKDKGQTLDLNIYEAASVCQCSDDGIEILTKALKTLVFSYKVIGKSIKSLIY